MENEKPLAAEVLLKHHLSKSEKLTDEQKSQVLSLVSELNSQLTKLPKAKKGSKRR